MAASTSVWEGRRVLVTGCDGFLGAAVTRELLARGVTVVGLLRDRACGAEYVREIAEGRFRLVRGNPRDDARLHAAMVVHEVSTVFHFADPETDVAPVLQATGLYHSRVPVIRTLPRHRLSIAGDMRPPPALIGTLRFEELFGPGDRDTSRFIPRTILSLLSGKSVAPASGGEREYVFIRDAAHSCIELAEAVGRAGRAIERTIESSWLLSDTQMIKVLASALAGSPQNSPSASFANAIGETIEWYRQFAATTLSSHANRRAA
jgi:dTDP-D-glucose 4,6-dehydratase